MSKHADAGEEDDEDAGWGDVAHAEDEYPKEYAAAAGGGSFPDMKPCPE